MNWKTFDEERPKDGTLIRVRRHLSLMRNSRMQYIGLYKDPLILFRDLSLGSVQSDYFPIYQRSDEWQEVEK